MLPKQNRLTNKNDFDLVFRGGKNIKGSFLVVKILKNNLKESRFGFIVSKKVSNKATVRNKIKRRLKDIAARELKDIKNSQDIVFIALSGIEKKKFSEIKEVVAKILKK